MPIRTANKFLSEPFTGRATQRRRLAHLDGELPLRADVGERDGGSVEGRRPARGGSAHRSARSRRAPDFVQRSEAEPQEDESHVGRVGVRVAAARVGRLLACGVR